ncbi:hypothetical protein KR059_000850, partial [Drosophila kikkawai]
IYIILPIYCVTIVPLHTDICHLPMQPGKCRHGVKAWYYNHVTKKCQRFIYTLCGGNENRFYTNKECMDYCNG